MAVATWLVDGGLRRWECLLFLVFSLSGSECLHNRTSSAHAVRKASGQLEPGRCISDREARTGHHERHGVFCFWASECAIAILTTDPAKSCGCESQQNYRTGNPHGIPGQSFSVPADPMFRGFWSCKPFWLKIYHAIPYYHPLLKNSLRAMASLHAQQFEILVACTCNCFSSVGMLLFNKLAVQALPLECSLVWLQLFFAAFFMLIFGFPYLHIGSMKDFLRWCMVVPFFTGMLMTSILALKKAPMSLVIVLRSASPLFSLIFERFYPEPLRISGPMVCAIVVMVAGAVMYVSQLHAEHWEGIGWVMLNSIVAVCDRLLQRLLLSKEQHPVDISKTGITVINNMMGLIPVGMAAYFTGEVGQFPYAYANLTGLDKVYIGLSCVIGLSIGFTGIWAQSLISATSFLVMVNANKFVIIGIEAFGMHTKVLTHGQILGASLSILGGILYGKARQQIEQEEEERKQLLPSVKV